MFKFSGKRKCQRHKRKRQSANGVAGPVTRTATAPMSVKVANTCAARSDGVALGIDRDQLASRMTQNMIATVTARCDDQPDEEL